MLEILEKSDGSCGLQNRDDVIEAYVAGRLAGKDMEKLEAHLLECEVCFRELQFQDDLKQAVAPVPAIAGSEALLWHKGVIPTGRAWRIAVAAILLTALGLYGGMRLSAPPFYELAKLTPKEQDGLITATRGDTTEALPEFAAGGQALLQAHQKHLGLLPYFEPAQVTRAISQLRAAYANSSKAFEHNECAYFLGKAFLMQANADSACVWFDRLLRSAAAIYQEEARNLQRRLDCNSKP
jgi:hypothetical protein